MGKIDRITLNSTVMGGKPCLRGLRVTVDTIVDLIDNGHSVEQVLMLYPYLELDDVAEALRFAVALSGRNGL